MRNSFKLTVSALFVAINVILASIALYSRLPIYMETLGTMLGVRLLGLKYGIGIAIASALVNSLYDVYAVYFLPTAIIVAIMVEFLLRSNKMNEWNDFIKAGVVSVPSATMGAMIAAFVFGGITSSGSSIILAFLNKMGLSLVMSAFVVQIATEYLDKLIVLKLLKVILDMLPNRILEKFRRI